MDASFDGQDYTLILDQGSDLASVKDGEVLESGLSRWGSGEDLGKRVTLHFNPSDKDRPPDGIKVDYLPPEHECWEEIEEVKVTVYPFAVWHIEQQGVFGTRYDGFGNKIEIRDGPASIFRRL